ncbi:MAG: ATP-binding cassette domain-containing protein [Candidatus Gastranaerophilales bacterium]|nr:ATP-binding cassette domain-containing protein [Candidatus Gastranaerophilales bacterium]
MLYQIMDGTVTVGGETVLSHIDFEVKGREKIALVGPNGAGKTTLLRLIAGELELDRDDRRVGLGVTASHKMTIGILHQNSRPDWDKTVEEILLEACPSREEFSRERYAYETEYNKLFTGFGFAGEQKNRTLSSFSGGEQTKISLIRLLLMKPDILLLDEPTNHLDVGTVEWLEDYLKKYEKAVVIVSHDRFFLDQVAECVYELRKGRLKRYAGNYTDYRIQKRKDLAVQRKAYERQQAEIKRLEALVEQFKNKPNKASFARSRRSILERMERIAKPEEDDVHIFTGELEPRLPGSKWVIEAERLKIGYRTPLLELSLRVRRGQKIGIIGENGVGKSTLLKTIAGLVEPLGGKCVLGNHILMGYFDQQTAALSSEKQVVEHFHDLFPAMTQKQVRQILGAYLFTGKAAGKRVSDLSGGEKARLVLAELLTERPNLLLLDEPTNHMDIQAKETCESAFLAYSGTILFISHDRYFIRQVADAILVLDGRTVLYYPFGYEHYLRHSGGEQGENLSALIQAEDQAMIADLRAVPKAERHFLGEMGTEEAYLDWKLRLAGEPMEEARERVEELWESFNLCRTKRMEEELRCFLKAEEGSAQESGTLEDEERLKRELNAAWERWTARCLEWFEAAEFV